eukprot:153434_1
MFYFFLFPYYQMNFFGYVSVFVIVSYISFSILSDEFFRIRFCFCNRFLYFFCLCSSLVFFFFVRAFNFDIIFAFDGLDLFFCFFPSLSFDISSNSFLYSSYFSG